MAPPISSVDRTFTVGISGAPFSGKTTLTKALVESLANAYNVDVYVVSQTDYICSAEKGPVLTAAQFKPLNDAEKKCFSNYDDYIPSVKKGPVLTAAQFKPLNDAEKEYDEFCVSSKFKSEYVTWAPKGGKLEDKYWLTRPCFNRVHLAAYDHLHHGLLQLGQLMGVKLEEDGRIANQSTAMWAKNLIRAGMDSDQEMWGTLNLI